MLPCHFNNLAQSENPEFAWDRVALHKWQKAEFASLREGTAAAMKTFLKMLRKYLEQCKAENVAI